MIEKIGYFFEVSGWTMYGIAVCSIFALAVFLERLWTLRREKTVPKGFSIEVEDLVRRGQIPEAVTLCRKNPTPLSRVVQVGLEGAEKSRGSVKETVDEVGRREATGLTRYMGLLNTTISVAPMLGFLGTVLGMVQLFTAIAEAGEVTNVGMIAGGIYKALYTTIAGLVVAIPATLFYRYLNSRIESLVAEMEEVSLRIVDLIGSD